MSSTNRKVKPYPHVPVPEVEEVEPKWVSLDDKIRYAAAFLIAVISCALIGAVAYMLMELI